MAKQPEKKTLPLVIAHGEIKTPPMSSETRKHVGHLIRLLQEGASIGMPLSRPMASIGSRCHELRPMGNRVEWRIIYHIAAEAVVVLEVFQKTTEETPPQVIENCKKRLAAYRKAIKIAADSQKRKGQR